MNILVVVRMAPDVVEELEIASSGRELDLDAARMILNESDEHALEEALLLKEQLGGTVTLLTLDAPEVDDALYAGLAKGADRAIKINGLPPPAGTTVAAMLLAGAIRELSPPDLILTGTQAIDDLDGLMAPLLGHELGLPCLSILTAVKPIVADRKVLVIKELPGGLRAEYEMPMPAVLGIQAAEKPPRYVPVAKVRAAMKTQRIEVLEPRDIVKLPPWKLEVLSMRKPEEAGHAEMLEGTPEKVAEQLCEIFAQHGVL